MHNNSLFCFLLDSSDHWAFPPRWTCFLFLISAQLIISKRFYCNNLKYRFRNTFFESLFLLFFVFFPNKQRATRKLHTPSLSIRQRWIDFIACSFLCNFTSTTVCACVCVWAMKEMTDRMRFISVFLFLVIRSCMVVIERAPATHCTRAHSWHIWMAALFSPRTLLAFDTCISHTLFTIERAIFTMATGDRN